MRLRKAARERRSSERRNNNVSWISEVKDISNVTVKKKRGRRARAPPSAKTLRGKKVDKVIDNDDAVDDDMNDTYRGQVGTSHSIGHVEEYVDGRDEPDLSKRDKSGDSSDGPSSAAEEQDLSANFKDISQSSSSQSKEKVPEKRMRRKQGKCQNDLENKDDSCMDFTAVKKGIGEGKNSREIKDDVFDAQLNTTSSEDKSSEEVEDVKVCDICGDVGEEDMLALCSRCHDGAEHIYCMRKMMDEVPHSEWLCEDCQTAVEFEKKKQENCEVKVGPSNQQSFEGKMSRPLDAAKSISSDGKSEAENVDNKVLDIANEGNDTSNSRMEEDVAITSSIGETVPEPGNIGANSRKIMPPSCESSFKSERDKGKQVSQVATSLASIVPKNQAPQPHGLSKSFSFNNSKVPKVKQLLSEVPQKPKILKESWSSVTKKEAPVSMTTKSATFKKPKPSEPTNKAKSLVLSTAEGRRAADSLVSQKVTTDRCTSVLGCPSSTATVVPPILSRTETTAQHLASGCNMTDSNILSVAPGHGAKSFLGNSELKKPPLAEGSTGILGPGAQRKIIQNSDASHRDNKIKDPPGFRQGASNNRTIRCQRCNEIGHSTQFCVYEKLRLSAIKPLSERNLKEAYNKSNTTSETSKLIATQRSAPRSADQSEPILKCGAYQSPIPNHRRDESFLGFSTVAEQIASTVPDLDYIWQGGFELWRTGRSPELCDGFQAHLSCSASQLVLDVAKKFPSKVQLEELPRQNSWPTQFQKNGPTYNNVGLFFFARDVQSYENHYSKLVENMLKNDLVLRGSVDTVELLIFPSNILSENLPRWNMFYFLWGVFRISKKDYSSVPPDVPKCIDNEGLPLLDAKNQECLNQVNSLNQPLSETTLDKSHDFVTARCSTKNNDTIDYSATAKEKDHQKLNYSEHQDKMCGSTNVNVGERDFDVNMVPDDCSMPLIHGEEPGKECKTINLNDAEQVMDMGHTKTVEINTGTPDSSSRASGGARKRDFGILNGATEVDVALGHKRVKLDNVSASSGLCDVTDDGRLSSKLHPLIASSVDDATGNKLMASTEGKCLFPLDLNAAGDVVFGDIVNIPSSDEDFARAGVQGPEEEIGGDRSSEKTMLSPLSPKAAAKLDCGNNLPCDVRGSLSLSLGFSSRTEQ